MMSTHSHEDGDSTDANDGEEPQVPEGVLRGIQDIADGNTASKEDLEAVLNF